MAKPDSALLTRKRETPLQWEVLLVIVLALSLVLGRVLSPVFLTGANISNILADLTEIALMALPMTLIIVAAEIDLSVASVLGASSALMGVLWHMGLPMPVVIVLVHSGALCECDRRCGFVYRAAAVHRVRPQPLRNRRESHRRGFLRYRSREDPVASIRAVRRDERAGRHRLYAAVYQRTRR
jgi:hypothetical protein